MRRVILDVDVGCDDYLAILLFLHAEKRGLVKIEAITCASGNTSVDHVVRNTVRLLEITERTDIPVFQGAHEPLLKHVQELSYFHGKDGLADLTYDKEPDLSIVRREHAAEALVNLVVNNPKEISLICLAPLTNIALSIKNNEKFASSLKDVWIMGGNYTNNDEKLLDIPGESEVEFNFSYDPEAAHIVLSSLLNSVFILPWEATLKPSITLDWRYDVLGGKTPALKLLTEIEKILYKDYQPIWQPCDAFMAFAFLDPEKHIVKLNKVNASIVTDSKNKGLLKIEQNKIGTDVVIIEDIHEEYFKDFLLNMSV